MKNAPQTFGANKLIHVSLTWLGMIVYLDYTTVYVLQHQFILAILVQELGTNQRETSRESPVQIISTCLNV